MYRFKELVECQYHFLRDNYNEAICEHVGLSLQLRNVYINPSWMFLVLNNDL